MRPGSALTARAPRWRPGALQRASLVLALCGLTWLTWLAPASADVRAFKKAWAATARLEGDAQREAQLAAAALLSAGDDPEAVKLLASLALDSRLDYRVRDALEDALATQSGPAVSEYLREALGAGGKRPKLKHAPQRVLLCHVLGRRVEEDEGARGLLIEALADEDSSVSGAALRGLRSSRRPEVVAALIELCARATGRLAADLLSALRRLTGERFTAPAEWESWWSAQGGQLPPPREPEGEHAAGSSGGAGGTRTRLDPPQGGRTIYGEIESSQVLFVIDVSGSMQVEAEDTSGQRRSRLDYVRESLAGVIEAQLGPQDSFNVLAFSSEVALLSKKPLEASPAHKKKALAWLETLKPQAGTNVYLALERAFQLRNVDTIYFLSDGSPSEGESVITTEIVGRVRAWNSGRGVRIEAIGFLAGEGSAHGVTENKGMAKRFLEALAANNDGSARFFE